MLCKQAILSASLLALLIISQFMIGEVNFLMGYADNIDMNYGKGQQAG